MLSWRPVPTPAVSVSLLGGRGGRSSHARPESPRMEDEEPDEKPEEIAAAAAENDDDDDEDAARIVTLVPE